MSNGSNRVDDNRLIDTTRRTFLKTVGLGALTVPARVGEVSAKHQTKSLPNGATKPSSIHINNGTYSIDVDTTDSWDWYFNSVNTLFYEYFALQDSNGSVVPSYFPDSIVNHYPNTGNPGQSYTAVIDYTVTGTPVRVQRTINLDAQDPVFSMTYSFTNRGDQTIQDFKLYQYCDYDIANYWNDYGAYESSPEFVYVTDEGDSVNVATGFAGEQPSSNHHVGSYPAYSAISNGDLNDANEYPQTGSGDAVVALQWSLGQIDPGETTTFTIKFGAETSVSKLENLITSGFNTGGSGPDYTRLNNAIDEKQALANSIDRLANTIPESTRVNEALDGLKSDVVNGNLSQSKAVEAIERMKLAEDLGETALAELGPKVANSPENSNTLVGEPAGSLAADQDVDVLGKTSEALLLLLLAALSAAATFTELAADLGPVSHYSEQLLSAASKADDVVETLLAIFPPAEEAVRDIVNQLWDGQLKDSLLSGAFATGDEAVQAAQDAIEGVNNAIANRFQSAFERIVPGPTLNSTMKTVNQELGPSDGGPSFSGSQSDAISAAGSGTELINTEIEETRHEMDVTEIVAIASAIFGLSVTIAAASGGLLVEISIALDVIATFFGLSFTGLSFVAGISGSYHVLDRYKAAADAIVAGDPKVTL